MAKYKVNETDLSSIADAIRTKGSTAAGLSFPDGFISAIGNIPSGGGSTLVSKYITENGTYDPADDDADGYSSVEVEVPQSASPFIKVGTYTVAESWESNQTGATMIQAALADYLDGNAVVYVLIFNGNTNTSSYRVDAIIVITNATTTSGLSSASGSVWKNYYASIGNLGGSARATQGTTIDIYRLLHS